MSQYRQRYLDLMTHGPKGLPDHLIFWGLWPFSYLYGLVVILRSFLYRIGWLASYRAGVPVVSVGNLTVGGTGKTPVVDALVKLLIKRGKKVAVVSRGYRGTFKGKFGRVTPAGGGEVLTPEAAGDEPFLLALKNPDARVYVARKRRFGVAAAEADGAECIVLDDAFQHLAVQRDLDIVLLDARNPFGNGLLLPVGLLREPRRALERADLLMLTHSDSLGGPLLSESEVVRCRHRLADYLLDGEGQSVPWAHVTGPRCLAFAGIARPEDFFSKLREKGCDLHETLSLADHKEYDPAVLENISKACQDIDILLTTEKDAVKLKGAIFPKPLLTVPLILDFEEFGIVEKLLDSMQKGSDGPS